MTESIQHLVINSFFTTAKIFLFYFILGIFYPLSLLHRQKWVHKSSVFIALFLSLTVFTLSHCLSPVCQARVFSFPWKRRYWRRSPDVGVSSLRGFCGSNTTDPRRSARATQPVQSAARQRHNRWPRHPLAARTACHPPATLELCTSAWPRSLCTHHQGQLEIRKMFYEVFFIILYQVL